MKQEKIDELMERIDRKCKLPKYWENFIEKNSKKHHLIIKYTYDKKLYCTNCNKYFIDKNIKVHDYIECPNCHTKSSVYGINYYRKSFEQPIVLVQRMDKKVIIRVFEIYSYFDNGDNQIKRSCTEYIRIIPGIGRFIGSNVYINMFGVINVYHGYKKISWSTYKGHKFFTDYPTYPYNKKKIVKGTNMEYAPINEFLDKFSYYRYNFLDVLELAAYGSFELLWNMKLYHLCFYSKTLNKNGSFYKRFGVPKNFLKYMQDKDISYKELMLLRLFQNTDDKIINKYRYENINHVKFLFKNDILDEFMQLNSRIEFDKIRTLKEISKFIPLKKLKNYPKGLENLNIYKDYLEMADKLSLNYKSKKDLFPRNLISRHDKMQTKIKVTEDMNTQFAAYLRYLELSKYTYENNEYIVFPAPSIASLKDEGRQQQNCVGHLYIEPYINGKTEIFFIRKLDDICKSFITLEFKDGKVVQRELSHHNTNFTKKQNAFIDEWCQYRKIVDNVPKYECKVIKYEFNPKLLKGAA